MIASTLSRTPEQVALLHRQATSMRHMLATEPLLASEREGIARDLAWAEQVIRFNAHPRPLRPRWPAS